MLGLAVCVSGLVAVVEGSILVSGPDGPRAFESTPFGFSDENFDLGIVQVELFPNRMCDDCQGFQPGDEVGPGVVFLQRDVYPACFGCGYERVALWAEDAGAEGVMILSDPDIGHEATHVRSRSLWREAEGYPAAEVELDSEVIDFMIAQASEGTNVTIDFFATVNPWTAYFDGPFYAVQVVCAMMSLWILFVVFRKARDMRDLDVVPKVTAAIVALEFLGNFIRLLNCIDMTWARGVILYAPNRFFLTGSLPYGIMSASLLFLHWTELCSSNIHFKKGSFMFRSPRVRNSFIFIACIFVAVDFSVLFVAIFTGNTSLFALDALIYAVFSLITGVLFFVAGTRLLRKLDGATRLKFKIESGSVSTMGSSVASLDIDGTSRSPSNHAVSSAALELVSMPRHAESSDHTIEDSPSGDSDDEGAIKRDAAQAAAAATPSHASMSFGTGASLATLGMPSSSRRVRQAARADANVEKRSARLQALTYKIRAVSGLLAVSAIVIAFAGQPFMTFDRVNRAIILVLFYLTSSARSYYTLAFFDFKATNAKRRRRRKKKKKSGASSRSRTPHSAV